MTELVCIVCPNGCLLTVEGKDLNATVTGAKCKKGVSFALEELTCPKRTVTSTVATAFKELPLLPVKTDGEVPKDKIFDIMNAINKVYITNFLTLGDVIIENVCDTNINIVSTSTIPT